MIRTALSFSTIALVASLLIAEAIHSSENTNFQYPERAFYLVETNHNLLNTPIFLSNEPDVWSRELNNKVSRVRHQEELLKLQREVS